MEMDSILSKVKDELVLSVVKTGRLTGLSETSIKNYLAKIKMLKIKAPELILNTITQNYPNLNSRLAYQVAILGVSKHSPTFAEYVTAPVIQSISSANMADNEIVKNAPKQLKSELEEQNWVDLKDLRKMPTGSLPIQDQLLISIYIDIPPVRLDYHKVYIVRTPFIDETSGLPSGLKPTDNYIQVYRNKSKTICNLVVQEHKTSETHGSIITKLPKKIVDLITQLPMTQNFLFETKGGGKPFASAESFGPYLRSVFLKLTGKTMSVDLLRHIYVSAFRKGEKTISEKQKLATQMGHSVETQQDYYRTE
jgi:hypothetical protein